MSGEIINAERSLAQVTQGIRVLTAQTVANMCQIGKLLTEAKAMVGHGGWGDYLEKEVSYSQSNANNFMRLYREYGEFGPNSQTIANLGTTKALALLSLPAEDREKFAADHEGDSVREFKSQIDALTRRAEKAEEQVDSAKRLLIQATEENDGLKHRLDGIDADYKAQLDTVDRENADLRRRLEAEESRELVISPEEAAALRREGAEAQAKEDQVRIAAAENKAASIAADKDREILELRGMLEKAQKTAPSSAANPNYGAFKAAFEALVPAFRQVCQYAVAAADTPEQVLQHRNVIKGLLLKLSGLVDREVTVA